MSLKDIYCQQKAVRILEGSFKTAKIPHAFIFAGKEGVGKFKTSVEWGKLLLCQKPVLEKDFVDSCEQCRSCQLFAAESHPDCQIVYKELKQYTQDGRNKDQKTPVDLSIDVIREFLVEKAYAKPGISKRKVFILKEAEKLSDSAQNALLKILEEPPGYCNIILICSQLEKLLPTIKSRCQVIAFGPIAEDIIIKKLQEMEINAPMARFFARLAQGSLGQGCQWAKLELAGAGLYQKKQQIVRAVSQYCFADALDLAEQLSDNAKEIAKTWTSLSEEISRTDITRRAQKTVLLIIISVLRDAMRISLADGGNITNFDQKAQIEELASRYTISQLAKKITEACNNFQWIDFSVNEKLIFEHLLLNLCISDRMDVLR